jgi:threonine synthase
MDISKASNFERYVFDIVGRRGEAVRSLWQQLDAAGSFDLSATPHWAAVQRSGFVSGRSTHADRLATIRDLHARTGLVIDPHTADGVKVAREHLSPGVPMICLETALPAKFAETIVEAIGCQPERPAGYADIESRPQRFTVMPADVARLKAYVEVHATS